MVVEVLADAGKIVDRRDADLPQMRGIADARQLQELRRIDGARRYDDLAVGMRRDDPAAALVFDAGGALSVEQDAAGEGPGRELHVPAAQGRAEIGVGDRPAGAVPHRHLHGAEAFLLAAVVVGRHRIAGLASGFDEGVIERIGAGAARDVQRAGTAAPPFLAAMARLGTNEIRENVTIRPAAGAHLLPGVEVAGMAAHVDHAVDGRRAADDLAARRRQAAAAEGGLRLGAEAPVVERHVHGVGERRGHLDERADVGAAVFEDEDRVAAVLAQPVRHRGTGRARSYDDVVERRHGNQLRWCAPARSCAST